jgi:hypothetical protein
MELNGATHVEETAVQFPQFTLLHSVPCVQLKLITILGTCGCVTVASFLGVPSPGMSTDVSEEHIVFIFKVGK